MARFFIDRPVFAWVIAIIIMLAGAISINTLPVSQYPTIALPEVVIRATYPGASAETLQNTVTQLIEQKMNGIDNLMYMSSSSESSGSVTIRVTFRVGTDPDIAQVQVQNKLQLAMPQLPQEVQALGISVNKSSSTFLMVVGFVSEDGSMNNSDIADYVSSNLQDPISRIEGVGQVQLYGAPYAMRIWIDPSKLNNYKLTIKDIIAAVQSQNAQISAGQLGGMPSLEGQQLNATVTAQTRLQTPEQFRNILLRVNQDGSMLRLGDVARVEMGQEGYDIISRYNRSPSTGLSVSLSYGANALDTADRVKEYVDEYSKSFPEGLKVVYPYDTTPFIRISIQGVFQTILEAVVLVFFVMLLFLQNFRATVIATITVPVVLLGTFAVLSAAGFSINTLTMLAMVLAIGNLVDDAIVVIENVERVMTEEGLSPKAATQKSMDEITGALIGMALVLVAVFTPMAFFGGSTGVIYRQFSVTMAAAMILSVIVAIVLTPALCATILKPVKKGEHMEMGGWLGRFFVWFNAKFKIITEHYVSRVSKILNKSFRYIAIYGAIIIAIAYLFTKIPGAFFPDEDQGVLMVQVMLPSGATFDRTLAVVEEVEDHFLNNEKRDVDSLMSIVGFNFSGRGQNSAMIFVKLKEWGERTVAGSGVKDIAARAYMRFTKINDALVFPLVPPAVIELGTSSGFDFQLQDRGNLGHEKLMEARNQFLMTAMSPPYNKILTGIRHNGQEDTPEYLVTVDQLKSGALGISLDDINDLLQYGWGSGYINDFIDKGRVKKVYLQAEADARMVPEDLDKWFVRNNRNEMVPFSAFTSQQWVYGSPRLERYNGIPSVEIVGEPVEGKSTGDAMKAVEEIVSQLPHGIDFEWTGLSLQEKQSGDQATFLYIISLLIVFLLLAALYESWSIPFSVMLVVPLGIIGVQVAALLFNQTNDVYFQVGFLTIIGLSAKNAILIVEFAKALREEGKGTIAAVMQACRLRLRPIIMTSMTFILGVLPLARSTGAGSGSHNAIGIGVMGGMITTTIIGIFYVPLFFVMITKLFGVKKSKE